MADKLNELLKEVAKFVKENPQHPLTAKILSGRQYGSKPQLVKPQDDNQ